MVVIGVGSEVEVMIVIDDIPIGIVAGTLQMVRVVALLVETTIAGVAALDLGLLTMTDTTAPLAEEAVEMLMIGILETDIVAAEEVGAAEAHRQERFEASRQPHS